MERSMLYNFAKKIFRDTVHFLGFEVVRYNVRTSEDILLKTIVKKFNIKTIIDVGANEGQYAEGLIAHGFNGKIYSFEPISSVYEKMKRRSQKKKEQWITINKGLGNIEAELPINVTANFASSSLYQVGEKSLAAEPATRITHQEKISITTLDSWFPKEFSFEDEVMLKLDVQGFELEALKGAVTNLKRIKIVQAELSFTEVYKNAPQYLEVITFLQNHEFELFTFLPVFIDANSGRMLQADGLFVRTENK
jgi:FkbM family methyltransferase